MDIIEGGRRIFKQGKGGDKRYEPTEITEAPPGPGLDDGRALDTGLAGSADHHINKSVRRREKEMFAENLKRIMWEKHMSGAELSRLTGIGKPSISQYINGLNVPKQERLPAIAEALGCTVEELMGGGPPDTPQEAELSEINYTMNCNQAAALMHKHGDYVRKGLIEGRPGFEFGSAVQTSGQWSFFISIPKFIEITGIPVPGFQGKTGNCPYCGKEENDEIPDRIRRRPAGCPHPKPPCTAGTAGAGKTGRYPGHPEGV